MPAIAAAVILAAGQGIRLGELGTLTPKGLLRLGAHGLVEESLLRLRAAGVRDVVLVTGHLREQFEPLARAFAGMVRLAHNADFAAGGSLSSLARALREVEGSFLLLESDLVYESRALAALGAPPGDSLVLVSGETRAGDEVWVETSGAAGGHRLTGMSKDRRRLGASVLGELTGLSRVAAADLPVLRDVVARLAAAGTTDYEDALVALSLTRPVRVHLVPDLRWAEIDTPAMLERVRREVYPAIAPAATPVPIGQDTPVPPSPQ